MKYNKSNCENYCIVIHLEQDAFYECRDRNYTIKDKVFCTLSNDWYGWCCIVCGSKHFFCGNFCLRDIG